LYGVETDFKRAIKLEFSIRGHSQRISTKDHPILHVAAGRSFAAAVLAGIGPVVWQEDDRVMDKHAGLRSARSIPVEYSIIGLTVGWHFLICLTEEGGVYRIDGLSEGSEFSVTPLQKFVGTQKFTSISGNFWKFGVLNPAGEVFIGDENTGMNDPPIVLPGLQRQGIVRLSWGDYHTLALCKDGSVLAWGKESDANGCLGLGYADKADAKTMNLVVGNEPTPGSYYIFTDEPRKVAFGENKVAVGIAANGWHSGALVVDSNQIYLRDQDTIIREGSLMPR
jgi:SCF-associated factor 1